MNFLKLLNYEANRFFKFFILLIGITAVTQLIGIVVMTQQFKRDFKDSLLNAQTFAMQNGVFEFQHFITSGWFSLPIFFAAFVIGLYIFLIWYRDWFGKSSFIYRLLMLPTSRMNVYIAKLCTILIYTLSMLAVQIVLLHVARFIAKASLPAPLYTNDALQIIYLIDPLSVVLPTTFTEFLLLYGFGLFTVVLLFTAILLERSYSWKGVAIAILYSIFAFLLLVIPFFIQEFFYNSLYAGEVMLATAFIGLIIIALSCLYSRHLLKYKVTV